MRKTWLWFLLGWLVLFVPEILRIYFIMPFPGSQVDDTINIAYFLHKYIFYIRILGAAIIVVPLYQYIRDGRWFKKVGAILFALVYLLAFYFATRIAQADRIFVQPKHKVFASVDSNNVDERNYVIGVALNGEAKAFPIQFIGYHHQVRDTIGGTPVIVTYCTVCRSGRAYSPVVNGKVETFRLVGMDHFNAMFEDASTGSWWRQENGEAIAGPMTGKYLTEIPSEQVTLHSWIAEHPNTLIMQRDTSFNEIYDSLAGYDKGTDRGGVLEGTDTASWEGKSWVVGVIADGKPKAYDWNDLKKTHCINDTVGSFPVLVTLEADTFSF